MSVDTKTCCVCGEEKPASAFWKHLNGLNARCRDCAARRRAELKDERDPSRVVRRELAARGQKACSACGVVKPADDFYARYFKCKACVLDYQESYRADHKAKIRERDRRYRQRTPDMQLRASRNFRERHRDVLNVRSAKAKEAKQNKTLETGAPRWKYEWAGWELEQISNYEKTALQLAIELGRTYNAVTSMRAKLRKDPKTIIRAGIAESGRF